MLDHQRHPTSSLRLQVRDETRVAHAALDSAWITPKGFASKQSYHDFLRAALRAHLQLGLPAATRRSDDSVGLERARISALKGDLSAPNSTIAGMPVDDVSFAWGVGYALNGSALGASAILKHGQLGQDWPRDYLEMGRAYARDGGVRSFFDRLDATPLDADRVVAGATAVFDLFRANIE